MSRKVSGEESSDSLDGDSETEVSKPVGLTGLQNLGNTCYMNAGIQALSNCPQLTGFMMDCGSYIRKPGLAKAYHRLINDMWSSKRPSYVVPVGISQGIKKVCPAFKGYTQHDAQEFLRCLLDQLHEELKEPVLESTRVLTQPSSNSAIHNRRHLRRERTSSQGLNREKNSSQGLNREKNSSQGLNREKNSSQGLNREKNSSQGLNNFSSSEESSDGNHVEEYETCDSGLSWDRSIDTNSVAMGVSGRLNGQREGSIDTNSVAMGVSGRLNGQREGSESTCTSGVFLPSSESTGTLMQSADGTQREFYVNRSIKSIQEQNQKKKEQNQKKKEQNQKKNVTYRSVISDVFDGKLLSSVQCLTCDNVSRTKETFQDLSLSIPTRDQLNALRASSRRCDGSSSPTPSDSSSLHPSFHSSSLHPSHDHSMPRGYSALLWGWIEWFLGWIWGPTISLEDCLSAFFSADELKGDNMYSCDKCKKLRNGIKYSKVLHLPDILSIHLKRFRHDLSYSCKISSQVSFPLHGLDMAPYMATLGEEEEEESLGEEEESLGEEEESDRMKFDTRFSCGNNIPHWTASGQGGDNGNSGQGNNGNSGNFDSEEPVTTFDLVSVICHHGTPSSGHYTAYCLNNLTDTWYEFDDQYVTAVDENQVASCEAYVLFYRKTNDQVCERRYRCVQLIERSPKDLNNSTPYYISNQWINRFNTFAHPGPISNHDFLCSHGLITPSKAPFVSDLCMSFNPEIWDYLLSTFGGGPPCTDLLSVCSSPPCFPSQHVNLLPDRFFNSKLLSFFQRVQKSNDSLSRQFNDTSSTTSLPATVLSSSNLLSSSNVLSSNVLSSSSVLSSNVLSSTVPQRTGSLLPLVVNGNGMEEESEEMDEESKGMEEDDYTSLVGTFGFDARRDLKRRRHEEKSADCESLLPTRESILSTRESILPTRESILPTRESILPTRESILPTRESILPTRESPVNGGSSLDPLFRECKRIQTSDETENGKKRNRSYEKTGKGDMERVPLIATNGCFGSADEESDEGDEGKR